jgi:ComF family protein
LATLARVVSTKGVLRPLTLARFLGEHLLALLAPPRCAACDDDVRVGALFCPTCASTVLPCPAPSRGDPFAARGLLAAGAYGGALATAIRRAKHDDRPELARSLGRLLGAVCREAELEVDVVVPVPLHARRLAERRFDQAALLARGVARALGVPMRAALVRRVFATSQTTRSAEGRRVALAGAFEAREAVVGLSVLLVDDVVTTGSTALAAARALTLAGARSVSFACVARTPRHDEA